MFNSILIEQSTPFCLCPRQVLTFCIILYAYISRSTLQRWKTVMTEAMKVYDVIAVTQFLNCEYLLMFMDKQMKVYALTNWVLNTSVFVHNIYMCTTPKQKSVFRVCLSVLWDIIRFLWHLLYGISFFRTFCCTDNE